VAAAEAPVIVGKRLHKRFRRKTKEIVQALDDVSFEIAAGSLSALVGPDGGGKTTLIRLMAGLLSADGGKLSVLGVDPGADPQAIQDQIGYMPQRFGLYDDLTVQENLDLYAEMHGVSPAERRDTYPRLMEMTALGPFTGRLAGQLSGGMKQKLGLACTLVRSPALLLLDEPTVGVDPLSRRELWEIIGALVRDQGVPVLLSTAYLDEAARCDHVVVLRDGKVLAQGPPQGVIALAEGRTFLAAPPDGETARVAQARLLDDPAVVDATPDGGRIRIVRQAGGPDGALAGLTLEPTPARFEDGFMVLLERAVAQTAAAGPAPAAPSSAPEEPSVGALLDHPTGSIVAGSAPATGEVVVEVRDLVRRFGDFVAVDKISFDVNRGEIFGLLGPNGAGKTTTFRMLCGLLSATSGALRVAGTDMRRATAAARQQLGYVAQKFSLYAQLSVAENLDFFASAYGLHGAHRRERIAWAMAEFGLGPVAEQLGGQLAGGYTQRLAMACALLHAPQILFLDEATSGADPLARREFWRRITALARDGVTVIVTTHFMAEAEYCDRIAILDSGRVLAQGPPAEIRARGRTAALAEPTMEDAFIAVIEQARSAAPREEAA
jgi:ABC-2 type transport system ATP-binding protein